VLIRRTPAISCREITDESLYLRRREFLLEAAAATVATSAALVAGGCSPAEARNETQPLPDLIPSHLSTDEEQTRIEDATSYNNFYEFGTGKEDPARNAQSFVAKPWSVAVEGEVGKPGRIDLEDLTKPHALEERIYRLRCVEAWSMVIPWVGFPLGDLLKRFEPTSKAKYVAFQTLLDPKRMPGQRRGVLDWPYVEGLRLDEAMNPLAILAVGIYGRELPNQNGAPLRLVLPWKYGFKSIKSIVKIRLTEHQPPTSWNVSAPREYGFYANVNPSVDHPRWSQKRERRIGEFRKRDTLPFNGYGEQVAQLYAGMDLRKNF